MSKYRVRILQTVYQHATIEIEASDEREAAQHARQIYSDGPPLQWQFDDCDEPDIEAELA
jgi:hypothetical protein